MKKILITGASGFIGSFIVEEALNQNFEVHAGIRKSSSRQYLKDPRIIFQYLDFDNDDVLRSILANNAYDYIVHNAGVTRAPNEEIYHKINASYTRKLIKILHEENVIPRKFIFMSSMASYGPADFQTKGIVDRSSPPHPVTQYGRSKLQAEQYIESFTDLPYMILRPTAVFGPRERDFISLYKSLNKGIELYLCHTQQNLSFIYVKDLVQLVFLAINSDLKRKSYFVSDGNVYPALEYNSVLKKVLDKKTIKFVLPLSLVRVIASLSEYSNKLLGGQSILSKDKLNELTANNWACDISPQREELGFEANYSLEQAIKETIHWNIEKGNL